MSNGEYSTTQETMVLPLLQQKNIIGRPFITVSAKGITNGLSRYTNDGADFGPDTLNTKTSGIQEAINYCISNTTGTIYMLSDQYVVDAPYVVDSNTSSGPSVGSMAGIINIPSVSGVWTTLNIIGAGNNSIGYSYPESPLFTGPTPDTGTQIFINLPSSQPDVDTLTAFHVQAAPSSIFSGTNLVNLNIQNIHFTLNNIDNIDLSKPPFSFISFDTYYASTLSVDNLTCDMYLSNSSDTPGLPINTSIGFVGFNTPNDNNQGTIDIGRLYVVDFGVGLSMYAHIFVSTYYAQNCYIGAAWGWNGGGGMHISKIANANLQDCTYWVWAASSSVGIFIDQIDAEVMPTNMFYTFETTSGGTVTDTYGRIGVINPYGTAATIPITIPSSQGKLIVDILNPIQNPFSVTTPTVPASGTAQVNTNPYPLNIYVYGGTVTEIQITKNGTAYTVFSNSTGLALSGQAYRLNPTDSITITYTTAPTWEWLAE